MIHLGPENWNADTKLDGNFHPAKFLSSDLNNPQEKLDSAMFRNAPIIPLAWCTGSCSYLLHPYQVGIHTELAQKITFIWQSHAAVKWTMLVWTDVNG